MSQAEATWLVGHQPRGWSHRAERGPCRAPLGGQGPCRPEPRLPNDRGGWGWGDQGSREPRPRGRLPSHLPPRRLSLSLLRAVRALPSWGPPRTYVTFCRLSVLLCDRCVTATGEWEGQTQSRAGPGLARQEVGKRRDSKLHAGQQDSSPCTSPGAHRGGSSVPQGPWGCKGNSSLVPKATGPAPDKDPASSAVGRGARPGPQRPGTGPRGAPSAWPLLLSGPRSP